LEGAQNANGNLGLTTVGNFTALGNTLIQATTTGTAGVTVGIAVDGEALFQGQVVAVNNSHIFADVSGDFTLENGPKDFDFKTDGTGQIVVTSDGTVNFVGGSGAAVASQNGVILQPTPLIQFISTPQVTTEGVATLSFQLGLPGEENFTYIVDWGDGSVPDIRTVDAGLQIITHTFVGPPDATNPGANIRVFLVAVTDINIHFFGDNISQLVPGIRPLQPPPNPPLPNASPAIPIGGFLFPNVNPLTINQFVLNAISPVNFLTAPSFPDALAFVTMALNSVPPFNQSGPPLPPGINDLGVATAFPVFPVPISGFGGVAFEISKEEDARFLPGSTAQPLPEEITDFEAEADDLDSSGSDAEDKGEDEVRVLLRVLSPSGQKLFEYEIDSKYLSNPVPLWARLTDGRYQIVIEEPGSSIPIVVRDVQLKDHKVIRRFDRTRRDAGQESSHRDNPAEELPVSFEAPDVNPQNAKEARWSPELPVENMSIGPAEPDSAWENWSPRPASRLSGRAAEPETESETAPIAAAAAFTGGLALAALRAGSSKDADSQMAGFSQWALSPAARLRRRLRKG
jgi:hypothetical protein